MQEVSLEIPDGLHSLVDKETGVLNGLETSHQSLAKWFRSSNYYRS